MDIVGLTERMDETLELLCGRLGIGRPRALPEANINPRKAGIQNDYYRRTIAPDLIEMVEEWTMYDRQLYEQASELFEQQLAACRAQRRRFYSLAPRLHMPVAQARQWLKQT